MNEMLIHKLDRSITLRYWLAVGLIALLSTGAFYFLKSALSGSDSTAYIVNLSGKQRMLSQRISLDVHRVYQFSYIQNKLDNTAKAKEVLAEIKAQLIKHCEVMETANNQLSSGQLKNNRKIKLSHTILQMYFGEMNVYQRVNTFTSLAKQIAKTENQSIAEQLMGQIDKDSELLLNDLNSVVSQYQKEGEKHLKSIAQMELFVWLITLAVLGLEVILIFRPMVKHLINAKQAEERTMDNLKGLVELRTLKLENSNEQLRKIAQHDPLTGLRNRLTLETDIEVLAENFNKHRSPFAVAMLDIDWFKKVNDSYGHDAGDYVLKEFAKILTELSRDYDKIYRAGGEEFMIVLNRISLDAVYSKLEKMRLRIQDYPFSFDGHSISITSSFGFYHTDLSFSSNVHNIIKLTDKALYKSKSLGRNRVTIAKIGKEHQLIAHTPARTQIIFTDDSLSSLIHIDKSIESLIGYTAEQFLSNEISFSNTVYSADEDILDKVCHNISKQENSLYTIRVRTSADKVKILHLEVEQADNRGIFYLQDAMELAKTIRDDLLVHNFHAMLEKTNDYIYFKDRNHVFTGASESLVELTSTSHRDQLIGKTDYEVFPQEFADEYYILEKEVFSGEVEIAQRFQPIMTTEGKRGWVDNRKYPIKNSQGDIIGLFGIARKISDNEYQELKDKFEA